MVIMQILLPSSAHNLEDLWLLSFFLLEGGKNHVASYLSLSVSCRPQISRVLQTSGGWIRTSQYVFGLKGFRELNIQLALNVAAHVAVPCVCIIELDFSPAIPV